MDVHIAESIVFVRRVLVVHSQFQLEAIRGRVGHNPVCIPLRVRIAPDGRSAVLQRRVLLVSQRTLGLALGQDVRIRGQRVDVGHGQVGSPMEGHLNRVAARPVRYRRAVIATGGLVVIFLLAVVGVVILLLLGVSGSRTCSASFLRLSLLLRDIQRLYRVASDKPVLLRVSSSRGPCVGSLHALHVPLAGRSDILGKVGNMRGQSVRCKPIACKSQPSCFPEMPIAIAITITMFLPALRKEQNDSKKHKPQRAQEWASEADKLRRPTYRKRGVAGSHQAGAGAHACVRTPFCVGDEDGSDGSKP